MRHWKGKRRLEGLWKEKEERREVRRYRVIGGRREKGRVWACEWRRGIGVLKRRSNYNYLNYQIGRIPISQRSW